MHWASPSDGCGDPASDAARRLVVGSGGCGYLVLAVAAGEEEGALVPLLLGVQDVVAADALISPAISY